MKNTHMLGQVKEFNFKIKHMKYFEELKKAMSLLAEHPKTIFIGQAVEYEGTGLYDSLKHLPSNKRIELPVAEYFQTGLANGIAIEGMIPVSTYPRWNFLLMGVDQVVNHLDKFIEMSNGKLDPKVIIRVAVGSERPVDPQCQHKGNFSDAFRSMLKSIELIELIEPEDIVPAYEKALSRTDRKSTILVEFADYAKTK
jgi:pyruvate/2-oxoglutarate/acetoin dehydrogenase E1 component